MNLLTLTSPLWMPPEVTPEAAGTNALLDADADRVAVVLRWPKTGVVDSVEFMLGAITTSAPLRVALNDVNASGDPDDTDDQYAVIAAPSASAWNTSGKITAANSGLDADRRSVAVGERGAIVLKRDGAGTIGINVATANPKYCGNSLYRDANLTGSWAKAATGFPRMAIKYSDGYVYQPGLHPTTANTKTAIGNGAERGLRFTLPFAATLGFVQWYADLDGPATIYCYDAGLVEQFAAQGYTPPTVESAYRVLANSDWSMMPVPPIRLEADRVYHLAIQQTSATAVSLEQVDVASGLLAAMPGGAEFYLGTRANTSVAFTDSDGSRPQIYLGLTQVELTPQVYWYNVSKADLLNGNFVPGSGGAGTPSTLKAMLVTQGYTFDPDHATVDDGTANDPKSHEAGGETRQSVSATRAATQDDANDRGYLSRAESLELTFAGLTASQTIEGMVVYRDTGDDTTSKLAWFYRVRTASGGLVTTDGTDVVVLFAADSTGGLATAT